MFADMPVQVVGGVCRHFRQLHAFKLIRQIGDKVDGRKLVLWERITNGEREGFLKAIDFTEAFEPGVETVSALAKLTVAFELERDIVFLCAERRLSKVVVGIAHGSVEVPNFDPMMGKVYYIILERAEGAAQTLQKVIAGALQLQGRCGDRQIPDARVSISAIAGVGALANDVAILSVEPSA